jgi:hypothetical protein
MKKKLTEHKRKKATDVGPTILFRNCLLKILDTFTFPFMKNARSHLRCLF